MKGLVRLILSLHLVQASAVAYQGAPQIIPRRAMLEGAPVSKLCDRVSQLEKNNDGTPYTNHDVYFTCRNSLVSENQIKSCAKAAAIERKSNGTIRFSEAVFEECVKLPIQPLRVDYCAKKSSSTKNFNRARVFNEIVFKACLELGG